jgi:signal peptidase
VSPTGTAERIGRAGAWALAAVAAAAVLLTAGPLPSLLHVRLLIVRSDSMAPAMRTGDLVVQRDLDPASSVGLAPGRLVTYRAGGKLITHRIVAVAADGAYVTKGDNNSTADVAPVPVSDVAGTPLVTVAGLGYVVALLRTPAPWLGLAAWFVWVGRHRPTTALRRPGARSPGVPVTR